MRREVGTLILACTLVSASWGADLGQLRELAQLKTTKAEDKPSKAEEKTETKEDAPTVETGESNESKTRAKQKAKASPGILPQREAAIKAFVDQHHPELAELLVHLKENNKKEYEKAVRDLFKTSERLAKIHETDVDLYDLELKLWQTQSRIDLLAARYKMTPSKQLRTQLKNAIAEQLALRKALVELDRERLREKLKKVDDQLKSMAASGNKVVEEQLRSLIGVAENEKGDKSSAKGSKSK